MTDGDQRRPLIAVLDYGIGNMGSAQRGLIRAGADALLTDDPAVVARADGVLLPGVGAFGACMDALERRGLDAIARNAAESGRPFLGICVGMQLLYEASEETPGRAGLGILPGTVRLLTGDIKRPQMQWNRISVTDPRHRLMADLDQAWMYFVHSYAAEPSDHVIATTRYGGDVVAAVAHANVWATQFHPEKSADAGHRLLHNWVQWVHRTMAGPPERAEEVS